MQLGYWEVHFIGDHLWAWRGVNIHRENSRKQHQTVSTGNADNAPVGSFPPVQFNQWIGQRKSEKVPIRTYFLAVSRWEQVSYFGFVSITNLTFKYTIFRTINCFELQELLDACLPNDYIKGCANIDICRQVIALQDVSSWLHSESSNFKNLFP